MFSKIFFPIALFVLFFSISAISQEENLKGQFNIGIQGGPQFTNINTTNPEEQIISNTGYTIGFFGEYHITNELKLRVGSYFDGRKYEVEITQPYVSGLNSDSVVYTGYNSFYFYQNKYSLNYLTFPVNVIYQKGNEKLKVLVQFGLYYSALLNATQNGNSLLHIDSTDAPHFANPKWDAGDHIKSYNGSVSSNYNHSDFGLNLYIGAWFKISSNLSITCAPGITYSFSKIYSSLDIEESWGTMPRFDVGVIYRFRKK